ncbi:MAG: transposase [Lentisphaeria bacterium]|nr:transposase [Lentisphaeria bacterium]
MPRPLRIEFPGACYHVMCRGNARLPVFHADADKELLLDRMVHFAAVFRVDLRAYCVMINHLHVHLRTVEGNLGAFMGSFLTSFTSMYNHRHDSFGHVFQGRYKAFLVEDVKAYRAKVTHYIHLNPACIPSLADEAPDVRHEAALHYPWSSYGQILGIRPCLPWLDRDAVLRGWGRNLKEKREAYRSAVEWRLRAGVSDPVAEAAAQTVLGSERFVGRMRRGLMDLKENLDVRRESSQHRKLSSWCSLEEVITAVRDAYRTSRSALMRRHNRGCEARQVLLYLAATHCRGRYSLAELGRSLGPVSLAAVSNARAGLLRKMGADPEVKLRVSAISSNLVADKVKLED